MTNEEFTRRYRVAHDADVAYEVAVRAAGFKSRWEVEHPFLVRAIALRGECATYTPTELETAYIAKVRADLDMHDAWEEMRLAAKVEA
jgi:hypothetical protein